MNKLHGYCNILLVLCIIFVVASQFNRWYCETQWKDYVMEAHHF